MSFAIKSNFLSNNVLTSTSSILVICMYILYNSYHSLAIYLI